MNAPRQQRASLPDEPSAFSWSTAAVVLLLLGVAAAIVIVGTGKTRSGVTAEAPPPPAYTETQTPVEVTVRSNVQQGELYVNGRSYGPLHVNEPVLLRLLPGAYRIEAREVDGTHVGEDVLIQPGQPTDVVLVPSTD